MEREEEIEKLREDIREEGRYRTVKDKYVEMQKIELLLAYLREREERYSEEELNGIKEREEIKEIDETARRLIRKGMEYIKESRDRERLPNVVRYIKEGYQTLGRREFEAYLKAIEYNYPREMKFYEPRRKILREWCRELEDLEYGRVKGISLSAPPRTGKALSLDSKILTPRGWKEMREIKEGEYVIGADGKKSKVKGVYPQGVKEMYRVVFDDRTEVKCSGEHLWEVETREDRKKGRKRVVKTEEMIKNYLVEGGKRKNYSIEYVEPVEYEGVLEEGDLKPYYLGVLLGNECISKQRISSGDKEVIERIKGEMPKGDKIEYEKGYEYRISKREEKRNEKGYPEKSETWRKIEEYGLGGKQSWEKFIPKKYMYSRIEERIELIRGLFDTEGYTGEGSGTIEYSTESERLAEDVEEIVRGLGGRVTRGEKIGGYRDKEVKKKESRKEYRLYIKMRINPFWLKRKAERYVTRERHIRKYKYIEKIEKIEPEECQCIYVENERHLYVTDGYNITHNTTIGERFLTWCMLRHPGRSSFFVSHTAAMAIKVYNDVINIIEDSRSEVGKIFPRGRIVSKNAEQMYIQLDCEWSTGYKSAYFRGIDGNMARGVRSELVIVL